MPTTFKEYLNLLKYYNIFFTFSKHQALMELERKEISFHTM